MRKLWIVCLMAFISSVYAAEDDFYNGNTQSYQFNSNSGNSSVNESNQAFRRSYDKDANFQRDDPNLTNPGNFASNPFSLHSGCDCARKNGGFSGVLSR